MVLMKGVKDFSVFCTKVKLQDRIIKFRVFISGQVLSAVGAADRNHFFHGLTTVEILRLNLCGRDVWFSSMLKKTPRAILLPRIHDSIKSTTSEKQVVVDFHFLKACCFLYSLSTTPISSRYHPTTLSIPLKRKDVREIGLKDQGDE